MEDYNELMRRRAEKAAELRAAGTNPYANDFRVTHTLAALAELGAGLDAEALAARESERYAVAGRVMAIRSFGKAAFLKMRDRTGDLQLMVRRDVVGEEVFEGLFKKTDVGDIVGAVGFLFVTKTGELTLQAARYRVLTKALRPLPEKWHGLTDRETRFRQRYVDLIVNPDVRRIFQVRAAIIRYIRRFFDGRDFMEVETPMMHVIAGGAAARPFETFHNALSIPLYLRIAPELFLKRLVVGGLERVYEINRNFRNEGLSQKHNPEFTMIEFYQAYATFEDLMDLTEELVSGLVEEVTGGTTVTWGDKSLDFARPWRRLRISEALVQLGGLPESAVTDAAALRAILRESGLEPADDTPLGNLQMEVFDLKCEHALVQPTFVTHFPIEVSPLSRRNDDEPHLTDRFELYVAGLELANAFSELSDPVDQRERLEAQMEQKAKGDDEAHNMDADFVRALEYGLPPTAGEGIGIDRLVMLLTNSTSIREVILFPHMRPEAPRSAEAGDEEEAAE